VLATCGRLINATHIPEFKKSVDLVSAGALNNQARYNELDVTRLKANVSNTGPFVRDMTILECEA